MGVQGRALEKTAMRVVGQLGRGGLHKGGLAPAAALDYAGRTFLSAVSYGVLVWGYVGEWVVFSEVLDFQTLSELACEAHEGRSACGPCPQAGPLRGRPLGRDARTHGLRLPAAGISDVARLEIHTQAALQNTSFNDT
jgi:hypothetical protein